jgi:hypothetical protein
MDVSYLPSTVAGQPTGTVAGQVYQVTDLQKDASGTNWTLRLEPPMRNRVTNVVVLEGVIAAFEKGNGWHP